MASLANTDSKTELNSLAHPSQPVSGEGGSIQTQVFLAAETEFLLPLLPLYVNTQGLWTPFQEPEGQDTPAQSP